MTLIVGILCKEGVVVGSDSDATFASGGMPTLGQQKVQKVRRVNDHIVYASSGSVGISQVIADHLATLWNKKDLSGPGTPEAMMDKVGKAIAGLVEPYLRTGQMQRSLTGDASTSLCKSLIAIPVNQKPCLFQFDYNGAPERTTNHLPFVSLGSGQPIADPFLALLKRLLWAHDEPTISEGRLAAVWTIDHVRRTNPGGVGGDTQLATLVSVQGKLPTVEILSGQGMDEHLQSVALAEAALVTQIRGGGGVPSVAAPPTPVPGPA